MGSKSFQPCWRRTRLLKKITRLLDCFRRKPNDDEKQSREPLPNSKTIETDVLVADQSRDASPRTGSTERSTAPKKPPPFHLTLLGLPRELRDLIFHHVFKHNGYAYVEQQLLGFPKKDYSTYSSLFRVLLTCRQIYAEAFNCAYRLSCFYWFKSYSTATLHTLCQRLNSSQAQNVRHIAFWSNPYLYEDFLDDMPAALRLTRVTVCSNYMSGPVPATTIHGRVAWLLKNVKKLRKLESFHFMTGCGISPVSRTATDCEFAAQLRRVFDAREYWAGDSEGLEVGRFDPETFTAEVVVLAEDEEKRVRKVQLKIASIYETGF
ncbi:hypothetical protein, variant [Verruconis gallopava]|uniref:Uncharacterized protein n=1 Tax=Verruconis gallopava TaxID=253628 RepID=A0A0D2BDS4_9PEZI|nr:uncharacterized protein PV09_00408 [Verruconis gallopava]XP_016219404.1 hypothetical protein, variant [Verruconis gallopava]KIW09534.1 hypothetical protein PV09_00408 [Verruconis gallopava]KIW09535.1 hypothetical protein, variant [Verruconis gallopava]